MRSGRVRRTCASRSDGPVQRVALATCEASVKTPGRSMNASASLKHLFRQAIVGTSPEVFVIYRVTARFRTDTATELRRRLDDGSIAAQLPDGQEIVDSLHRAIVTPSGDVQWSEMCFCDPPLAHERATILDHHFDAITTEAIDDYERYDGQPFIEHLQTLQPDTPS